MLPPGWVGAPPPPKLRPTPTQTEPVLALQDACEANALGVFKDSCRCVFVCCAQTHADTDKGRPLCPIWTTPDTSICLYAQCGPVPLYPVWISADTDRGRPRPPGDTHHPPRARLPCFGISCGAGNPKDRNSPWGRRRPCLGSDGDRSGVSMRIRMRGRSGQCVSKGGSRKPL